MRKHLVLTILITAIALSACGQRDALEDAASSSDDLTSGSSIKTLNIQYQAQQNGYWCGPAAARIVLSARMNPPSQNTLANDIGTTTAGTNAIGQVTDTLNAILGAGTYENRILPNDPPTPQQVSQLWNDVVRSIDAGYGLVTNIVAPPSNHPPGYPNTTIFHYFAVVGYNKDASTVLIADPASFSGHTLYWIPFEQLATLIPPKGYSAAVVGTQCPNASPTVIGAINAKYQALGGCGSPLGSPITEELTTPDTVGRYTVFDAGSIYWTPTTDAHEVLGRIRDAWKASGWEVGPLGYPTSDEYDVVNGRKSDFQHGSITWDRAADTTSIAMNSQ